jgi:hypothetical protein
MKFTHGNNVDKIKNILYVPSKNNNLILVRRIVEYDMEVSFDNYSS